MIARTWHGVTRSSDADGYVEFLRKTGIPDYKATPGNRGVFVFRRIEGNKAHFLLLTLWDSYESIKKFAGNDVNKARYYPDDPKWLLELEPFVTHYEVVERP